MTTLVEQVRSGGVRIWNGDTLVSGTCADCQNLFPARDLTASRNSKGGRKLRCLPCGRVRANRIYQANAEDIRKQRRAKYAANMEHERARTRNYLARNSEKRKAYWASYREENREVLRQKATEYNTIRPEVSEAWRKSERGKASKKASMGARRARLNEGNCGCVTAESLLQLWETGGGLCAYCNAPAAHYDHVMPLARGGRHCIDNLALACAPCNFSKGAKTVAEFLGFTS